MPLPYATAEERGPIYPTYHFPHSSARSAQPVGSGSEVGVGVEVTIGGHGGAVNVGHGLQSGKQLGVTLAMKAPPSSFLPVTSPTAASLTLRRSGRSR